MVLELAFRVECFGERGVGPVRLRQRRRAQKCSGAHRSSCVGPRDVSERRKNSGSAPYPAGGDDEVILFAHPPRRFDNLLFLIRDDLYALQTDAEVEAELGEVMAVRIFRLGVQDLARRIVR